VGDSSAVPHTPAVLCHPGVSEIVKRELKGYGKNTGNRKRRGFWNNPEDPETPGNPTQKHSYVSPIYR